MRKTLLMILLAATTVAANAQVKQGTFSIMPKVGANVTMLPGDKLNVSTASDERELKNRMRVGLVAGVEADYRLLNMLSISAAAIYSQQGSKYKDEEYMIKDLNIRLDYLNVPVMANFYILPYLAVKVGMQWGWLLNKSVKGNLWGSAIDTVSGKNYDGYFPHKFDDLKDDFRTIDFSIPVGLCYEFDEVSLDLRYNFGITDIYKPSDVSLKNSVIQMTLGYRIAL